MRTRIISSIAIACLALTACGGGGASGDRGELVDELMDAADDEGSELDRGCIEGVMEDLSDDDVAKLKAAGIDGDVELSEAGDAQMEEAFECVDISSMIDPLIEQMQEEMGEDAVDADCIREAVGDLDLSDPDDPALMGAMFDCIDIGG